MRDEVDSKHKLSESETKQATMKGDLATAIVFYIILILHLVALLYHGWPCGTIFMGSCAGTWDVMYGVLVLLIINSALVLLTAILYSIVLCLASSSSAHHCLLAAARVLSCLVALIALGTLIYYYYSMFAFWCHLVVGVSTGMAVATSLIQMGRACQHD